MITPSFGLTATERVLPKLALDFTTANLDSRITFTRTTGASNPATYTNSSGVITAATNDQPRFDYDPVTLACKGLLIEELRTNFLLYSSTYANWTKTNVTAPDNAVTSPDGTTNAGKLINNNGITGSGVFGGNGIYRNSASIASGSYYTISVYAKAAEKTKIGISIADSNFGVGGVNASVDLSTLIVTNIANASGKVVSVGNGWYRFIVTSTTQQSVTGTPRCYVYNPEAGDGTSGLYVWGAQLEAGAFATSYIPTTTTSLTRNADVATMTGTNFSDWYNASEGSFYSSSDSLYLSTSPAVSGRPLCVNDNTTANALILSMSNTTALFEGYVSGAFQGSISVAGTYTANTIYEQTAAYKLNNVNAAITGTLGTTDTSFTMPTVTQLKIGAGRATTAIHNGHIQEIMYWPQRLTNAELQAFSK